MVQKCDKEKEITEFKKYRFGDKLYRNSRNGANN
jgi:hypothetical protein